MAPATSGTADKESKTELSEAEIAVHWKEKEDPYPKPKLIGREANLTDPSVNERFSPKNFPEVLPEVGRHADLGQVLDPDPRHEQRPGRQVVRRRESSTPATTASATDSALRQTSPPSSSSWNWRRTSRFLTYKTSYARVNEFAALRDLRVRKTGQPRRSTCRWWPSLRLQRWPALGSASSIRSSSEDSAGSRRPTGR